MSAFSRDELRALLRHDLYTFTQGCFHELEPATVFLPNWHLELICAKLEAVKRGEIKRLIVMMCPRSLKSHCVSVAFPAFLLGHDPYLRMMCVSYGQDLADTLARACRAVMLSPFYNRLFPQSALLGGKQSVGEFTTAAGGYRFATSVGGTVTGRGADIIIVDDPQKPDDAMSDARRRSTNEWYDGTLFPRLNDKATGAIIVVMQRLHEDDLVGHLLQQEGWEVVRLPSIAEEEQVFHHDTIFGPRRIIRRPGDVLHPARDDLATLMEIKRNGGEYHWASQHQQNPAPAGGGLVKRAWFQTYDALKPPKFERIVQSWDCAISVGELADYSVCTTWGVFEKRAYLVNVFRKRLAYPDLMRAVIEQRNFYDASVVLIEDQASGKQLLQEFAWARVAGIKAYMPQGDKVMRMHAQTDMVEGGFVFVPTTVPWLAAYIHELTIFPNGRHDDQVDSTSQFLDWFKIATRKPARIIGCHFIPGRTNY